KSLPECGEERRSFQVVLGIAHQHTDAPHPLALLRAPRERPRGRTAEQRHERAPVHSITSSARCCRCHGTSRPSDFAVLRLITNSNVTGGWTGRSLTFSPFRIRSTYDAVRRKLSSGLLPYDSRAPASVKIRNGETAGSR